MFSISSKSGYGKQLNMACCRNNTFISIVFQGLIGPQGPIGPPGEKVSKEGTQSPPSPSVLPPQLCYPYK